MTKARANLTELEGAILGVLREGGNQSAYRVRQVFLQSRSAEWSGSAGAVYPAIRRLLAAGMIRERVEKDGRGTRTCAMAPAGRSAHDRWLGDVARAIGPGMDPFRTRAALWSALAPQKRRSLLRILTAEVAVQRAQLLRDMPAMDRGDAVTAGLLLAQMDTRLAWLAAQEA